jgi:8-amino-7-oxononanoate synthase
LQVYVVALLKPGGIPKTTSGKIQRQLCREKFLKDNLSTIAVDRLTHPVKSGQNSRSALKEQLLAVPADQRDEYLLSALQALVADSLALDTSRLTCDDPLTSLGLSSLMALRLIDQIEAELGVEFSVTLLLEGATISQLAQQLTDQLVAETEAAGNKLTKEIVGEVKKPAQLVAALEAAKKAIPPELYQIDTFPEYRALQHLFDASPIADPYFKPHEQINSNTTRVAGRELINFSSYNYLGLSGHPDITRAAKEAIERYGTSVSANRLVSGEIPLHGALEAELAGLIGVESCMVYVGGHATNVTTIGHLMRAGDLILHDQLIHNSVIQGATLSGAAVRSFPHNNWAALDAVLTAERHQFQRVLIVIEGVYSMDGDIPDLPGFIEVKQRHKALLMVDEAHSMGTIGPHGRGISNYFAVDPTQIDIWMGTLSKTFASCGGYIAGNQALIKYLKYTAPGFVYSVGMSPANTGAALAAVRLLKTNPEPVIRLQERAGLFLKLARQRGLNTGSSHDTPVIPVIVGDSYACAKLAETLFERGISVFPIIFPVVPADSARLRFFLSCTHTDAQIRLTVDAVAQAIAEFNQNGH